jgi:Domain of unknown function (DUF1841)
MFVDSRDQARQFFFAVWEKLTRGEALSPLEALIANVIRAHPEYHRALGQGEGGLQRDYGAGDTNPFLHMGLHVALIEQLQTDRPPGIMTAYRQLLLQDSHDVHGLEHRLMDILAAVLWTANQRGAMPDEQDYLARVRALLR